MRIIKNPIANGAIIGNSGITVVPIIETSPIVSGFMLSQTCVPLLIYSWNKTFSLFRNTEYGFHNNSNGIIVATNWFSLDISNVILFVGCSKTKLEILE